LSSQQEASDIGTRVTVSDKDSLPPRSIVQLTPQSNNSRIMSTNCQQEYHLRECKPSEMGTNCSETEEGSIPMTETSGSNTQTMPIHLTQNRMFQAPVFDRSTNFITKYATSPLYAPIHPDNAILLKDVSPRHHRAVLTSQNANGGEQYEYGFLPTALVLSEINDTYTALSESTQRKRSAGNPQALELNEI
uniref:Pecanex-like protein n=1 Tax=Rodentolepis nana TaxID=102285 RepID=A0A0R3TQA5_RODNA